VEDKERDIQVGGLGRLLELLRGKKGRAIEERLKGSKGSSKGYSEVNQ